MVHHHATKGINKRWYMFGMILIGVCTIYYYYHNSGELYRHAPIIRDDDSTSTTNNDHTASSRSGGQHDDLPHKQLRTVRQKAIRLIQQAQQLMNDTTWQYQQHEKHSSDRTLVIARYNEDTTWIDRYIDPMIVRYQPQRINASAPNYVINKGNEAMVYLHYIVSEYHRLPLQMFFIHGHQYSPHQTKIPIWYHINHMKRPPALNYTSLSLDYESPPRCHSGAAWGDWANIGELWDRLQAWLGERPRQICGHSFAQFMVSRHQILSRPLPMWRAALTWLRTTQLDTSFSGRVMEYVWTCLFGYCNGIKPLTIDDIIDEHAVARIPFVFHHHQLINDTIIA